MKVFLDGMPLLGAKTGIGHYVDNLYTSMLDIKDINVQLLCNGFGFSKTIETSSHTLRKIPIPYDFYRVKWKSKIIYDSLKLEYMLGDFDIYHGTNYVILPTKRAKRIVTIHDLSFIKYPQYVPQTIIDHHTEWSKYSIENSDFIIVDSESTAEDLQTFYKVKDSKVSCVYLAASQEYRVRSKDELIEVKAHYALPEEFILFVGTIESRKNVLSMLKSYKLAKEKYGLPHKFVLIGGLGHEFEKIQSTIIELNIENDVVFLGYIIDEHLPLIYNLASLFIYVSLYEGFGLPALEAMQSGVPTIVSNSSSLPEVVGDAGIQVDPLNINEISENIAYVLLNENVSVDIRNKGINRAKEFSWLKTAEETIKIYSKI